MTFLSDAIVGLWHGMDITFSDIEEDSLCMDMDSLHISPKTKAIIVVDCHGRLANIKKLREKWDGFILEDAAHAMWTPGVGEYSDLQMYSFQAVKTMPIGDGGMLTTDDEDMAKEARRLSWLNIEKSTYDRTLGRKYTWDYDVTRTNGIKAYMTNTQAVIGLGQLKRLDNMLKRRREIQATYNEAFKDIPQIKTPQYSHTVQYYTMQCEDRDELSDYLSKQTPQIQTSVHFKPLYEFQAYKQYKKYSTPVCDRVWKRLLSLPCHNALTDEEQDFVIKKVREFYGK
jgi:perosamine synthetase